MCPPPVIAGTALLPDRDEHLARPSAEQSQSLVGSSAGGGSTTSHSRTHGLARLCARLRDDCPCVWVRSPLTTNEDHSLGLGARFGDSRVE